MVDWLAYFSVESFPEERADFRTALLGSQIINMSGKSVKREVKAQNLIPNLWGESTDKSIEQQRQERQIFKEKYLASTKR